MQAQLQEDMRLGSILKGAGAPVALRVYSDQATTGTANRPSAAAVAGSAPLGAPSAAAAAATGAWKRMQQGCSQA